MMNFTWLNTFCTLAETGHFTRTAEQLNMTQPGVSQHLRKLEQSLGKALIQREGKGFQLTDPGALVYQQAREMLLTIERLKQQLQQDEPTVGLCRLASPGSVGLKLYPKLLDWQQQHPKLELEYSFAPNERVISDVKARKLDIGLVSAMDKSVSLQFQPVGNEALQLITSFNVETVNWATLMQLGYLNHPDGHHHGSLLLQANFSEFKTMSQLPQRGFSNQIGLILEPVARNIGFTVLPAYAVAAFAHPQRLRIHRLPVDVCETLYTVSRKWETQPARIKALTDLIETTLNY